MSSEIKELVQFLQIGARTNIKEFALEQVLSLTASDNGAKLFIEVPDSLVCLLTLLSDNSENISKDAASSLVNISSLDESIAALLELNLEDKPRRIEKAPDNIIKTTLKQILNRDSHIADESCMILSNLTRDSRFLDKIIDLIEDAGVSLESLINVFTKISYNQKGANLHHLASVFSNISQNTRVRKCLLDKELDNRPLDKLLSFVEYKHSDVRRLGVVGTVRNCCFDTEYHNWLLNENGINILAYLTLPLAGNEEYNEEDSEKLPYYLQFLPEEKVREESADIRCMLVEAMTQLCAVRENREFIRNKNIYLILRELHKWERDEKTLMACENLVDLLIKTEDEINVKNLKEVEIPEELEEKFNKFNDVLNIN